MADWVYASCEAMYRDDQAPTAPLGEFLEEYERDDNVWWMIGSGHHLNLFEAAVEARDTEKALADKAADVLAHMVVGWKEQTGIDLAEHPSVVAFFAEYREARK